MTARVYIYIHKHTHTRQSISCMMSPFSQIHIFKTVMVLFSKLYTLKLYSKSGTVVLSC